ncbi:MAG: alanine--tRNA ligase [Planctomycetes bacterium]|nr:alanine--tRNA ligase [Planctomycetota bacterium]
MKTPSTATRTAAQIRREFIDFFVEKHGHTFVPSSPVVPHDDPTLLFANAGMNQFKDVFLGHGRRDWTRAANTQKCIRAGGKHNDLEDVGKDNYHHTFFEMLGNWSFGDYFKAEAIEWAWDLLTTVWGLDKDRLHVTVFGGDQREGLEPDEEAAEVWKRFVDPSHISRWGKKDNFWEMGDTGPCGPCSEIHYDFTPGKTGGDLVNAGDPRVIELWNLVFIEFNSTIPQDGLDKLHEWDVTPQSERSKKFANSYKSRNEILSQFRQLTPLPAKHVDTGMGLERLVRVLQHVQSNYDIDLFTPIFKAIEKHTGAHPYRGTLDDPVDIAYRVIADHIRCLTVAVTDGCRPSNEGRGYVLRRILRRAVRHAHQTLQTKGAWLHELVPTVVQTLGDAFPELNDKPDKVAEVIRDEEKGFLTTLDRGMELFDNSATDAGRCFLDEQRALRAHDESAKQQLLTWQNEQRQTLGMSGPSYWEPRGFYWHDFPGENRPSIAADDAFKLHDTYGFPLDLTRVMAQERGMTVDEAGFNLLMAEARERSRTAGERGDRQRDILGVFVQQNEFPATKFVGYDCLAVEHAKVLKAYFVEKTGALTNAPDTLGQQAYLLVDDTPFYAEAGGQVGDAGVIESAGGAVFRIDDTIKIGDVYFHHGIWESGKIRSGDPARLTVDAARRARIMANHTATHLLNFALRAVIGPEEDQKGSLVAPDRLRFDFSCSHGMTDEQIEQTERLVNADIEQDLEVFADVVPLAQARSIAGVRAVFGEKYPNPVRVVAIGAPLAEVLKDPGNEQWSEFSIELCGGTHLPQTGEAKQLVIIQEQALAAGVRRITAVTGRAAHDAEAAGRELEARTRRAAELGDDELLDEFNEITTQLQGLTIGAVARGRIDALLGPARDRVKRIHKHAQAETRAGAVDQARRIASAATGPIIVEQLSDADHDGLLSAMDVIRAKHMDTAVMLFGTDEAESKVSIVARVPQALIERGLKAGDWVREAAKACGGRGGGRADMAQAGAKNPAMVPQAITAAKAFAEQKLK